MKKLLTLALVCTATAVIGQQSTTVRTSIAKQNEVALSNTVTPRETLTYDGHFPWQDSEWIAPVDTSSAALTATASTESAFNTMMTAFGQTYTELTETNLNVTEITLNGRQCGEISVKTGQNFTANYYSIPKTLGGLDICRIADDGFANNQSTSKPVGLRIDAELDEIGARAFKKSNATSALQQVMLPNSLKKIGDEAFRHTGFRMFVKPKLLEEIGAYAYGDTNKTSTTCADNEQGVGQVYFNSFPKSNLRTIGEGAFYCNTASNAIINLEGVTSVGANAFYGANPSGFIIPKSLTSENIGDGAFRYRNAANAFGLAWPKVSGINIKHDVLAADWLRWFGDKNPLEDAASRIRLSAFDKDAEFAKNKFYYLPEVAPTSTFNFTPDQTREVDFNSVTEDFVLPAGIAYTPAGITLTPQTYFKVTWSSSDEAALDVSTNPTDGTVNVNSGMVQIESSLKKGLAVVTRKETEWQTVKLIGKILNPFSGDEHTKEFTVKIKPMKDVEPEPLPEEEELEFPGPTVTTTSTMDWSWIWYVIAGVGALLLVLFFIILIKRRKKDDNGNGGANTPIINY